MQNSQCHSLHPEKISLRSNANADIFRGSETVFFLPNAQSTLLATLPTTHFSGAVKNKALIGCIANVMHKVCRYFTSLHFGKLQQNLPSFIPFHFCTPYCITTQQAYFVPHTLAFFQRFKDWYALFLLRIFCPIANAQKEVIGHFPKEKRIKREAKLGGSAQCQR